MSPGIDAVETVLVAGIFDDVLRMTEGKLELMAFHGEDTAESPRGGVDASREMGAVGGQSSVVDQVAGRHDGHCIVQDHARPEDALVEFLPCGTVIITHLDELVPVFPRMNHTTKTLHGIIVVEERILSVPLVDDSPPRSPSPDIACLREEIVVRGVGGYLIDVEPRDHPDALIIFIPVEQLLTEGEERL